MLGEPIGNSPEMPKHVRSVINYLFAVDSGSIGSHTRAVDQFYRGGVCEDDYFFESVVSKKSNLLAHPYVQVWKGDGLEGEEEDGPTMLSPFSSQHLELESQMSTLYYRLRTRIMIAAVSGISPVQDEDGDLTRELESVLLLADSKGYISLNGVPPQSIAMTPDVLKFVNESRDLGVTFSPIFFERVNDAEHISDFQPAIVKAASYKLGFMLGVTEQATYDAGVLSSPLNYNYQPQDSERRKASWRKWLGQEMPGIGGLYEQAHGVLARVAPPDDPYLAHILAMPTPPQLIWE